MANSTGTIVQCIGAVVDIQFPIKEMPKVYEALKLISGGSSADLVEEGLTLEVEQQLGDGIVRCIALGSRRYQKRHECRSNRCTNICASWPGTLGRIMDVLGRPIDEAGKIDSDELRPIHNQRQNLLNFHHLLSYWKQELKLLILYVLLLKAERLVCLVVLESVKQLT